MRDDVESVDDLLFEFFGSGSRYRNIGTIPRTLNVSRRSTMYVWSVLWLLARLSTAYKSPPSTSERTLVWEEEVPAPSKDEEEQRNKPAQRKLQNPAAASPQKPHPLRTAQWKVYLHGKWRGAAREIAIEFADNGYLRCDGGDLVGRWNLTPTGMTWSVELESSGQLVEYSFYADLHPNPFGRHPRMTRGVIIEESRHWFRPVVGTFSAIGVGEDNGDNSYRGRN